MTLVDIGANLTHSSFREAQAFERRIEVLDPDLDFAHARPAQGGERSRREGDEGAGDHRRRARIAHEGMQACERQHGAPEL
jgi:hypothetical protein